MIIIIIIVTKATRGRERGRKKQTINEYFACLDLDLLLLFLIRLCESRPSRRRTNTAFLALLLHTQVVAFIDVHMGLALAPIILPSARLCAGAAPDRSPTASRWRDRLFAIFSCSSREIGAGIGRVHRFTFPDEPLVLCRATGGKKRRKMTDVRLFLSTFLPCTRTPLIGASIEPRFENSLVSSLLPSTPPTCHQVARESKSA